MSTEPNLSFSSPRSSYATKRRKPMVTYRSPSSHQDVHLITSSHNGAHVSIASSQTSSSSSPSGKPNARTSLPQSSSSSSQVSFSLNTALSNSSLPPTEEWASTPSTHLPLYHPFGPLAQSLPPLDPVALGLPISPRVAEALADSSRARKQGEKILDILLQTATSTGADSSDIASPAPPDKPSTSPRKRRNNGTGGGGPSKRRKKDNGDGAAAGGDGTVFPAKRTRSNRAQAFAADADPESAEAIAEMVAEERRVSTRTTRSRAPLVAAAAPAMRRSPSASEAEGSVASVPVAPTEAGADVNVGADAPEVPAEPAAAEADVEAGVVDGDADDAMTGVVEQQSQPKEDLEEEEVEEGEIQEESHKIVEPEAGETFTPAPQDPSVDALVATTTATTSVDDLPPVPP